YFYEAGAKWLADIRRKDVKSSTKEFLTRLGRTLGLLDAHRGVLSKIEYSITLAKKSSSDKLQLIRQAEENVDAAGIDSPEILLLQTERQRTRGRLETALE